MKTKILFAFLFCNLFIYGQTGTNKIIRESDLKAYYDSTYSSFGGANLEPELVVTPASSKIVMDVDSVGIRGKLDIDNDIIGSGGNYTRITSRDSLKFTQDNTADASITIGGGTFPSIGGGINIKAGTDMTISSASIMKITAADRLTIDADKGIVITDNLGGTSYTGGEVQNNDITWVEDRGHAIYIENGIKTDGNIVIDNKSHLITSDTIFVATVTIDSTYTFPISDGSLNQVLKTNGSGVLTWQSDATGAGGAAYTDSVTHDGRHVPGDSLITDKEGYARFLELSDSTIYLTPSDARTEFTQLSDSTIYLTPSDARTEFLQLSDSIVYLTPADANVAYQSKEATLTDIADGTITENLVNTANPWAENEVASTLATETEAKGFVADSVANTLAEFDTKIGITGTPSSSTYWRGDNSWSTPGGTGDMTKAVYDVNNNTRVDDTDSLGGVIASGYATTGTTQTITGQKTFSNSKTIFSGDSITVMKDLRYSTGVLTQTDLSYLDGTSSSVQNQLNGKQATIVNIADTSKYFERMDTVLTVATQYDLNSRSVAATLQGGVAMVHNSAWVERSKDAFIDSLDLLITDIPLLDDSLATYVHKKDSTLYLTPNDARVEFTQLADSTIYLTPNDARVEFMQLADSTIYLTPNDARVEFLQISDSTIYVTTNDAAVAYQPKEATLTDIADGTITENLVNTTNPWADNEVADGLTVDEGGIASTITRDAEWDTEAEVQTVWGSVNVLLETEIDGSSEMLSLMDDETGTGTMVFNTSPTFAGAVTHAGIKIQTHSITTDSTLAAALCYGGVFYVPEAQTITLPAIASGMSMTFITIGAVAVSINPNNSDKMILDGTGLADGDKATNTSTTGDMIVFTYLSADGWYAASGSNDGDLWTDGN